MSKSESKKNAIKTTIITLAIILAIILWSKIDANIFGINTIREDLRATFGKFATIEMYTTGNKQYHAIVKVDYGINDKRSENETLTSIRNFYFKSSQRYKRGSKISRLTVIIRDINNKEAMSTILTTEEIFNSDWRSIKTYEDIKKMAYVSIREHSNN